MHAAPFPHQHCGIRAQEAGRDEDARPRRQRPDGACRHSDARPLRLDGDTPQRSSRKRRKYRSPSGRYRRCRRRPAAPPKTRPSGRRIATSRARQSLSRTPIPLRRGQRFRHDHRVARRIQVVAQLRGGPPPSRWCRPQPAPHRQLGRCASRWRPWGSTGPSIARELARK